MKYICIILSLLVLNTTFVSASQSVPTMGEKPLNQAIETYQDYAVITQRLENLYRGKNEEEMKMLSKKLEAVVLKYTSQLKRVKHLNEEQKRLQEIMEIVSNYIAIQYIVYDSMNSLEQLFYDIQQEEKSKNISTHTEEIKTNTVTGALIEAKIIQSSIINDINTETATLFIQLDTPVESLGGYYFDREGDRAIATIQKESETSYYVDFDIFLTSPEKFEFTFWYKDGRQGKIKFPVTQYYPPIKGIGIILNTEGEKIVVNKLFPGKPAEKAGLMKGDIILTIDDINMEYVWDIPDYISSVDLGKTIKLGLMRNGEYIELKVLVEEFKIFTTL